MAYFVISCVTILFIFFVIKGVRGWRNQLKHPVTEIYGLVVKKYAEETAGIKHYFIIFQVREVETVYQIPHEVYIKIEPPVRGLLRHRGSQFVSFE
ncbi:hypothetical protein BAU15_02420 [Enterococcus sp. JM4C]|uniref:hypothetical protein n=1 Tax=Candidatus Enterococcus huntleyi TaxID=1857217 RepID=UPI001F3250FD|nr:hypothetical protein [Enterococcus sp. JM4C]KAF1299517.1 hypothetical protein BAU15_02420 [Enterococcus sp. JM4C]